MKQGIEVRIAVLGVIDAKAKNGRVTRVGNFLIMTRRVTLQVTKICREVQAFIGWWVLKLTLTFF